jgi:hypothetical protein
MVSISGGITPSPCDTDRDEMGRHVPLPTHRARPTTRYGSAGSDTMINPAAAEEPERLNTGKPRSEIDDRELRAELDPRPLPARNRRTAVPNPGGGRAPHAQAWPFRPIFRSRPDYESRLRSAPVTRLAACKPAVHPPLKHQHDIAGGVAEWFKAPVLKTGRGFRSLVGSNPTPSATCWR